MNENVAAYLITLGSFGVVLCLVGGIIHWFERRESSTSPTAGAHSRRDGPAAHLLTMDQDERRRAAFERCMARIHQDLDAMQEPRGQVTRPVYAESPDAAIEALLNQTTPPRRSQR